MPQDACLSHGTLAFRPGPFSPAARFTVILHHSIRFGVACLSVALLTAVASAAPPGGHAGGHAGGAHMGGSGVHMGGAHPSSGAYHSHYSAPYYHSGTRVVIGIGGYGGYGLYGPLGYGLGYSPFGYSG